MSNLRGDIFSVNRLVRSGTYFKQAMGRGKTKVVMSGLILGTYVVSTIGRFAPRLASKLGKGLKKLGGGNKAGRNSNMPDKDDGSLQDDVNKNEDGYTETKPLKDKDVKKLEEDRKNENDVFSKSMNDSTMTLEDIQKLSKPIGGEPLRIQEQIVEACKRFNITGKGTVMHEYEPPYKKKVIVKIEGYSLKVYEKGIYGILDEPYYIEEKMSKSEGLTRLVKDFDKKYITLFIDLLTLYDVNVYNVLEEPDEPEVVEEDNYTEEIKPPF